jgi:hypothetical protein
MKYLLKERYACKLYENFPYCASSYETQRCNVIYTFCVK